MLLREFLSRLRAENVRADVKVIVKYIGNSVFRHQNVEGGGGVPPIFVWGAKAPSCPPTPPPMRYVNIHNYLIFAFR